jgi:hypothetical protein
MLEYGNKIQVCTYVDKETYDFLCQEKGLAALSVYMRELIMNYKSAVQNNEVQYDPNVN